VWGSAGSGRVSRGPLRVAMSKINLWDDSPENLRWFATNVGQGAKVLGVLPLEPFDLGPDLLGRDDNNPLALVVALIRTPVRLSFRLCRRGARREDGGAHELLLVAFHLREDVRDVHPEPSDRPLPPEPFVHLVKLLEPVEWDQDVGVGTNVDLDF